MNILDKIRPSLPSLLAKERKQTESLRLGLDFFVLLYCPIRAICKM